MRYDVDADVVLQSLTKHFSYNEVLTHACIYLQK